MKNLHSSNPWLLGSLVASIAIAAALPASSMACGEGTFNTGKGLAYQGYLAPRPATVLIYTSPNSTMSHADRDALYSGLKRAGHTVTVVDTADGLGGALREHHFDVVITSLDSVNVVNMATASANSTDKPHLLPVVERGEHDLPNLRSHFSDVLTDGASLGQYLKDINHLMASAK